MKNVLPFLLVVLCLVAQAQDKDAIYLFDANWKPVKKGDPTIFFLRTHPINDSCWRFDFYHFLGPLLMSAQFRDEEGHQRNGVTYHYNEAGFIDSMATYRLGLLDGDAYKLYGDSLRHKMEYLYRHDTLLKTVDCDTLKKDSTRSYPDEKESDYPGGIRAWGKYLTRNLAYPQRAQNGNVEGQVVIVFIVDKAGHVIDPVVAHSVEYSLDDEAIRIIENSGQWRPAFQNGHIVKSYKQQPINFRLR